MPRTSALARKVGTVVSTVGLGLLLLAGTATAADPVRAVAVDAVQAGESADRPATTSVTDDTHWG